MPERAFFIARPHSLCEGTAGLFMRVCFLYNDHMKYWKVTLTVEREDMEGLTGRLLEEGVEAWEVVDPQDIADVLTKQHDYDYDVVDRTLLAADPQEDPKIILYIPEDKALLHRVEEAAFSIPSAAFCKEEVEDSLWLDGYKEHFGITSLADGLLVVPSWEEDRYRAEADGRFAGMHPIFMDPGTAFGTGDHPTTAMCAALMEHYGCRNKVVLDVGTGSGILAIGAALLGAQSVLAVDIDPEAVRVAKENVERNALWHAVTVREGDLLEGVTETADMVVANLFAEVIIRLSGSVRDHLFEGGIFLSTGILTEKRKEVEEALKRNGFALVEARAEGEWCALAARKE